MFLFSSVPNFVSVGGSTPERVAGRTAIAESKVTIKLKDETSLQKCLVQLEESDKRLSLKGDPPRPSYDWQFVLSEVLSDGTAKVHFGVSWFDKDFFEEKKSVFTNMEHQSLFNSMGVDKEDVHVEHWVKTA